MAAAPRVGDVLRVTAAQDVNPATGYIPVLEGDEVKILHVEPGEWLFVARVSPQCDRGWLPVDSVLPRGFSIGDQARLVQAVEDWAWAGFEGPLSPGETVEILFVGDEGDSAGWVFARRHAEPHDRGWLREQAVCAGYGEEGEVLQLAGQDAVSTALWECTNCGEPNKFLRIFCNACATPSHAVWECAACGELNKPTRMACNNCSTPKIRKPAPDSVSTPELVSELQPQGTGNLAAAVGRCPLPKDLPTCIVGDSGLQLNKSKGTAAFDVQLQSLLGPNVDVVRYPGEGAEAITRCLQSRPSTGVAIAVWNLNELFDKSNALKKSYPVFVDGVALCLARELRRFSHRVAVVGGSATLWNVSGRFDEWADRVRDIFRDNGIWVVDGIDCYSKLSMKNGGWHARSTDENKMLMASYYASLVRSAVAEGHLAG